MGMMTARTATMLRKTPSNLAGTATACDRHAGALAALRADLTELKPGALKSAEARVSQARLFRRDLSRKFQEAVAQENAMRPDRTTLTDGERQLEAELQRADAA